MFNIERSGTGTKEWSETSENICLGCANNCLYCYAAANAHRFKTRDRADWSREELTKKADRTSYPAKDGVIMFPSSHDITPYNVDAYIRVAKLILEKGNKLLIVTKPDRVCMLLIMTELMPWQSQIHLRFTIGALDGYLTKLWEPGAPHSLDRLDTLADANHLEYARSVSIEPMLGGVEETLKVVQNVAPWEPETIWIGKMNKIRLRVTDTDPEIRAAIRLVEWKQRDSEILRLVDMLKDNPVIRWKDSIKQVIANSTAQEAM